jgi:ABC-type nitrate/sulfonate/bicarbonate transport system permease component
MTSSILPGGGFGLRAGLGVARRLVTGWLPVLAMLGLLVLGWEMGVAASGLPRTVLAPPSAVVARIVNQPALFIDNAGITLLEVGLGFAIGVALGIVAAVAIVHSRVVESAVYPLVLTSQVIPTFALAPLLVLWLGFGLEPKIAISVVLVFFPVTVNMVKGFRSVDPGIVALMRSFRASRPVILRTVLFPAALPFLFAALELAVTYSVLGAVFAEWFGAFKGLGKLTLVGQTRRQTDLMLAAVLLVTMLALTLFAVVRWAGRRATPWLAIEPVRRFRGSTAVATRNETP